MYELTYATKKRVCTYCHKPLTKQSSTIDHNFPRAIGGISITNNLFPACSKCNVEKSDMTNTEYFTYLKLDAKDKQLYRQQLLEDREDMFYCQGFNLPSQWINTVLISKIKFQHDKTKHGKRYHQILKFYKKYQNFPRPVILDKNLRLLDGLDCLLIAKEQRLKLIPAIVLDNVELVKK
jgi:hypothetical protein